MFRKSGMVMGCWGVGGEVQGLVGLEKGERTKLKVSKAVFDKPERTLERVKGTKRKKKNI
jgi:hypothetical protein